MPLRGHHSKANKEKRDAAKHGKGSTATEKPVGVETGTANTGKGNRKKKRYSRSNRHSFRKKKIRALDELEGVLPSIDEISDLLNSEEAAIRFLKEKGVIDYYEECPRCGVDTKIDYKGKRVRCRRTCCSKTAPIVCEHCLSPDPMVIDSVNEQDGSTASCHCRECQWSWSKGKEMERSMMIGSILQNGRLEANKFIHLLYLWLLKSGVDQAAIQTGIDRKTVGKWFKTFRQLVSEMTLSECSGNIMLGGLDGNGDPIVVEIDESKFAKRKYNKGRRANGDWVFGMVERTEERKCVMVVVKDRTADTLIPIITHFVKEGSIIHSDMWQSYNSIGDIADKEYIHKTLCHDIEFVAPDGVHTQTIEGNWSAAKRDIPVQQREGQDLQEHLFEFMWRRQNSGGLWEGIFKGLSAVRYTVAEMAEAIDERDQVGRRLQEDEEAADEKTEYVPPGRTPKNEEELPLSCDSYESNSSDNTTSWYINQYHARVFDEAVSAPTRAVSERDDRKRNREDKVGGSLSSSAHCDVEGIGGSQDSGGKSTEDVLETRIL